MGRRHEALADEIHVRRERSERRKTGEAKPLLLLHPISIYLYQSFTLVYVNFFLALFEPERLFA